MCNLPEAGGNRKLMAASIRAGGPPYILEIYLLAIYRASGDARDGFRRRT
jgi:hypothetical protein